MLSSVSVHNIAILDEVSVEFQPELTVITGETGSGKSILIESIALAFGQKISPKTILRHGTERGFVELQFTHVPTLPAKLVEALGLDSQPDELVIRREFSPTTSRYRVEGTPVTADVASQLRPYLVDLHGQHDLTSLFEPEHHRKLLDSLGDNDFQSTLAEHKTIYGQWRLLQRQIEAIHTQRAEFEKQQEFFKFQYNELKAANLGDAEEDHTLRDQLARMKNAEHVITACDNTQQALLYGTDSSGSMVDALENLGGQYRKLSASGEADFDAYHQRLSNLTAELRTLADDVAKTQHAVSLSPAELDTAVERLDTLEKIRRKFGPTLHHAIAERDRLAGLLGDAEDSDDELALLEQQAGKLARQLDGLSATLSATRQTLAKQLADDMTPQLKELALPAARFDVMVAPTTHRHEHGSDAVEFGFSANPGEPIRPLQAVASGGELSRVLLGLKVLAARHAHVGTLVFDEIDTGISGPTAKAVANKLKALAAHGLQVLCITHQPLVAAAGQHHLHVEKQLHDNHVTVIVHTYHGNDDARRAILATLTTGEATTDDADQLARQLLAQA